MTHLRKMMLEELQRRHYSEATTQRYIRFIERFAQHFHCSPDRLGPKHIRQYQAQLFTVHKLTPGSKQRCTGQEGVAWNQEGLAFLSKAWSQALGEPTRGSGHHDQRQTQHSAGE